MADFSAILGKKATEVVKPPVKPVGTYIAQIAGLPKQENPTVQGEERVVLSFPIKLLSAQADVDPDKLSAPGMGEIHSWPAFKKDFWIDDPQGEYALTQFLTHTLDIPQEGTLGEMVAQAVGKQLIAEIIHKPYISKQTGEPEIAANLGKTAKA